MKLTEVDKRLLALHYVFPVPVNRLERLFMIDPNLEKIFDFKATEFASLLNIPIRKASRLQENLNTNTTVPYDTLYEQKNIIPIPFTNSQYPDSLKNLIDPPAVLYACGNPGLLHQRFKIAIIGSRKATAYSNEAMELIVPPLVESDVIIVSGLATGADTLAHKAAIKYGGKTIAVLGHGFFHLYPKENRLLADEIIKNHLLITEYPPYVKPEKWTFPMRNRIISGLSDAVIVTEAADKSGTMSTVEHALDHGKDIFAVPGPITSALSIGPNKLIEEGAKPIWNGFQVVETLIPDH
ncbi:DNA-processing protein DprA [Filibacter tadaridae]|uniref:Smf/DprA SLOG domain-containing protein n=1 Tax=Filibacter tadaridae TaxID=2483811 RepID=A0A3P5XLU0_9BACL|nr:DNA-processing protein DprA [Filibacter tadaridae]VDC29770.1 hypothetical protein FILTAD_02322 [Filibacter tadaridae]